MKGRNRRAIQAVTRLSERVRGHDRDDLLATVAALQLLPENAHRQARLMAFAHAVAALRPRLDLPTIRRDELEALIESPLLTQGVLAEQDDPFENIFTEAFPDIGGSFTIFPGTAPEAPYTLRVLCTALFRDARTQLPTAFLHRAFALIRGALILSDEVARRAGLTPGIVPPDTFEAPVTLPPPDKLEMLKAAVTFRTEDIASLLKQDGEHPRDLALITTRTTVSSRYHIDGGDLTDRPLLRTRQGFIVTLPGDVLYAVIKAVTRLAYTFRCQRKLATAFGRYCWSHVIESFSRLSNKSVENRFSQHRSPEGCFQSGYFMTDSDTFTLAILVTDPLMGPTPEFEGRIAQYIKMRLKRVPPLRSSRVWPVVILQSLARPMRIHLGAPEGPAATALCLGAAELDIISHVCEREPLALWKFWEARHRVRHHVPVFAHSALDEFQAYRDKRGAYSGYFLSTYLPELFLINLGAGRLLRREAQLVWNRHGAPIWSGEGTVEVERQYRHERMPLYVPRWLRNSTIAILVEELTIPIWILPTEQVSPEDHERWQSTYHSCDAVGFWLWQASPSLAPVLKSIEPRPPMLRVEVESARPEEIPLSEASIPGTVPVEVHASPQTGLIRLTLSPPFWRLLNEPHNSADRALLEKLVEGLILLTGGAPVPSFVTGVVDRHAPPGMKRRIIVASSSHAPDLDYRGLPLERAIHPADTDALVDEMSVTLVDRMALRPGVIPEEQRGGLLKSASEFYFGQLQQLVAETCPDGLLEGLLSQHEAMTHWRAKERHSWASREAIEDFQITLNEEVLEDLQRINKSSVALRILIEYVAAQPPAGDTRMSVKRFDRMMALADLVFTTGMYGDALHYRIGDLRALVFPSGRIVFASINQFRASDAFGPVHAAGEIDRAKVGLPQHYTHGRPTALNQEWDEASLEEFGFTFTDIAQFLSTLTQIESPGDSAVTCIRRSVLEEELGASLGWPLRRIQAAIALFSLGPREQFWRVEPPYKKEDVYPWRFSRQLSYVRRPLVIRQGRDGQELLWGYRHVYVAFENLRYLCLSGRLQATHPGMKRFLSQRQQLLGEWFNDEVARTLAAQPGLVVRARVDKVGDIRPMGPQGQLGDIDVLTVDPASRHVWAIECKHLSTARTPYELRSEFQNMLSGAPGRPSIVEKHGRRTEWLKQNLSTVLTWLGLQPDPRDTWRVEPLIVLEREMLSAHLQDSPIPIIALHQLRDHLAAGGSLMDPIGRASALSAVRAPLPRLQRGPREWHHEGEGISRSSCMLRRYMAQRCSTHVRARPGCVYRVSPKLEGSPGNRWDWRGLSSGLDVSGSTHDLAKGVCRSGFGHPTYTGSSPVLLAKNGAWNREGNLKDSRRFVFSVLGLLSEAPYVTSDRCLR